jgi:hypothetical protein
MVGFDVFIGVQGEVWLAIAAVLFIPGIIALQLQLAASESGSRQGWPWLGTPGTPGIVLAVVGVLTLELGQLGSALHLGGTVISCGHHCLNVEYSGSVLSERVYAHMQAFGTWGAIVGMGIVSVITLLSRPFSWRARLPSHTPAIFPEIELLLQWVVAAFLLGRDLWNEAASGTRSPLATKEAG